MSSSDENVSFDEEEDDPDHMTIPGAPVNKLASMPTMDELFKGAPVIHSASLIRPTVNNSTIKITPMNPRPPVSIIKPFYGQGLSTASTQSSGVQLLSPSVGATSAQTTFRLLRPTAPSSLAVKSPSTPQFTLLRSGSNSTAGAPSTVKRVIRLSAPINTQANNIKVINRTIKAPPQQLSNPPLIDLTDNSSISTNSTSFAARSDVVSTLNLTTSIVGSNNVIGSNNLLLQNSGSNGALPVIRLLNSNSITSTGLIRPQMGHSTGVLPGAARLVNMATQPMMLTRLPASTGRGVTQRPILNSKTFKLLPDGMLVACTIPAMSTAGGQVLSNVSATPVVSSAQKFVTLNNSSNVIYSNSSNNSAVAVSSAAADGDLLSAAIFSSGVFDLGSNEGMNNNQSSNNAKPAAVSAAAPIDLSGITVSIPGLACNTPVTTLSSLPPVQYVTPQAAAPTVARAQLGATNINRSTVTKFNDRTIIRTGSQVQSAIPGSVLGRPRTLVNTGGRVVGITRPGNPSPMIRGLNLNAIGPNTMIHLSNGKTFSAGQLIRPTARGVGPTTSGELMMMPSMFPHPTDDMEEDDGAMGIAETFANYKPSKLKIGREHPDLVVESASMASVEPPDVYYRPKLPAQLIDDGRLSALQLETITYVGQKHECILPDGNRAGFLVGDGAGVGKGRTIAGIIFDNHARGRKKSVWISASADLKFDAERDLADIGAAKIKVRFLSKMKYAKIYSEENGNMKKGVLFVTYPSLIGESSSIGRYSTRLKQIIDWCGDNFEGCIVFDECHRAKNLCPAESGKPTKTGLTVLELQNRLPKARVVYVSATGASEPKNMAYMVRLGLWGDGTPFKGFGEFISAVEKRGVGAMEMIAMDMKLRGLYIARQLSFHGVTFRIEEAPLTEEFRKIYDDAVRLWVRSKEAFTEAALLLGADANIRKTMWAQFYSAHQRFFKYLCIAFKVPTAVKLCIAAVKNNRSVVIGLQSTGEARTLEQLEKEDGELSDFISTAKGVVQTLVEKHFPASNAERVNRVLALARKRNAPFSAKGNRKWNKRKNKKRKLDDEYMSDDDVNNSDDGSDDCFNEDDIDNMYNKFLQGSKSTNGGSSSKDNSPAESRSNTNSPLPADPVTPQSSIDKCRDMKDRLIRQINGFGKRLPPNTLDQLIDELGGPDEVAEMTGRKGRVVQSNYGNITYESRSNGESAQELLNVKEKERFMDGVKTIAIISEAASSGISLHSDRRAKNQLRRVHLTLELPWSADKAIQQFGRTHRSNQVNAPEYVFLISELAGERRFASIVAKRLESMGALTHGDRRTADTRDLSSFNIDNQYGRDALIQTMNTIMGREVPDPRLLPTYSGNFFDDVKPALVGCGLASRNSRDQFVLEKDATNITKFLNRILGMPVSLQNSLFEYFTNILSSITAQAKRAGKYDKGILDLCVGADGCESTEIHRWSIQHSSGKTPIGLLRLKVERGLGWQQAIEKSEMLSGINGNGGFFLSKRIRSSRHSSMLAVLDPSAINTKRPKPDKLYNIFKPNLGLVSKQERYSDIKKHWDSTSSEDVKDHWELQYKEFETTCSHKYWQGRCEKIVKGQKCEYGLRHRTYHVLCGSILNLVGKIEDILSNDNSNAGVHRIQMVRFKTNDKLKKFVGLLIPNNMVKKVYDMLNVDCKTDTADASMPEFFNPSAADHDEEDDDIIMIP